MHGAPAGDSKRRNGERRRWVESLLNSYRAHAVRPPPPSEARVRALAKLGRRPRGAEYPPRLACCGLQRAAGSVALVELGQGDTYRTQWAGYIRCRSKACPYCLSVRRSNDAACVTRVAKLHHTAHQGATRDAVALLLTCTLAHSIADNLRDTRTLLGRAWRRMHQGRAWVTACARWGLRDWVCGTEPTFGVNGWHPHSHTLVLQRRNLDARELRAARLWLALRWQSCVVTEARKQGLADPESYRPSLARGVDLRACKRAEYIAKLGLEVSDGGDKRGRVGHSTPLQLLDSWRRYQNPRGLVLYQAFESASRGRKDLTWSKSLRGFRDLARVDLRAEWELERKGARVAFEIPGKLADKLLPLQRADIQDGVEGADVRTGLLRVASHLGAGALACVVDFTAAQRAARSELVAWQRVGVFAGLRREWWAG